MALLHEGFEYARVLFARNPVLRKRLVEFALNDAVARHAEQHEPVDANEQADGRVTDQE